jgi:phosphoglycerate dehydrogenase-like enzyme
LAGKSGGKTNRNYCILATEFKLGLGFKGGGSLINSIGILHKQNHRYADRMITERHLDLVRQRFKAVKIVLVETETDLIREALDAEVLITWGMFKPPLQFCREAGGLKWIHALSAGVDALLVPEVIHLNIPITCTKGIHGLPVSDHVLAFILAFTRGFPRFFAQKHEKKWARYPFVDEVTRKTVAIIGLGSIGREIARRCKALEMRVVALCRKDERFSEAEGVDFLYSPGQLPEMLAIADFVVLALPLTEKTRHFMDREKLGSMKKTAVLINIGRGGLVDEEELISALKEGRLAGAGLDVFSEEPLPMDNPLWGMENVIITPHTAALSPYYIDRAMEVFCQNLARFQAGEPLLYLVDAEKGY